MYTYKMHRGDRNSHHKRIGTKGGKMSKTIYKDTNDPEIAAVTEGASGIISYWV